MPRTLVNDVKREAGHHRTVWNEWRRAGKAEPNWDAFAYSLDEPGLHPEADQELKDAVRYLNSNPPQSQVARGGSPGWEDPKRGGETRTQWLLLLIRRVRDSLYRPIQAYSDVDLEVVWQTATNDLSPLVATLKKTLRQRGNPDRE